MEFQWNNQQQHPRRPEGRPPPSSSLATEPATTSKSTASGSPSPAPAETRRHASGYSRSYTLTNPYLASLHQEKLAAALGSASSAKVRHATVALASAIQTKPEAERILAVAALFVLILRVYDLRPSDLIPRVEAMMADPQTNTYNPEFLALRDYLLTWSEDLQRLKRERQLDRSLSSSL